MSSKKGKKQVRNKAKDVFVDYYKTNRQYHKENSEREKEQGESKEWKSSEKIMLVIIILGLIGCLIRYVIL